MIVAHEVKEASEDIKIIYNILKMATKRRKKRNENAKNIAKRNPKVTLKWVKLGCSKCQVQGYKYFLGCI